MSDRLSPPSLTGLLEMLDHEGRQRLLLLLNHVLASEPVAAQRLSAHAGKRLRVTPDGWPRVLQGLLPAPPPLEMLITPAGLLELATPPDSAPPPQACAPDLEVVLDSRNPVELFAGLFGGPTPPMRLVGQAQLAADVNWLAENLRWDLAADLERVFGPVPAAQLQAWGRALAQALRGAARRFTGPVGTR